MDQIKLSNYVIGAHYCRQLVGRGGVCIFIHESLRCSYINLYDLCSDKDIEVCAIQLQHTSSKIYILAIYRAPSGNFNLFISILDTIVQSFFKADSVIIICGDFNINYLVNSEKKTRLNAILQS
jgi:exonuclease III